MAPLPVIADTARVALSWFSSDGTSATNVLHVHAPGKTAAQIATILDTRASTVLWHNVSSRAHVQQIEITPLDGTTATQIFNPATPANWVGVGSASNIVEACTIIQFRTAQRGARGRGRLFLPFVPEDATEGGILVGSNLTQPPPQWRIFADNIASDGATLVVASYVHADQHTVTSIGVDQVIGIQRRRVERLRG